MVLNTLIKKYKQFNIKMKENIQVNPTGYHSTKT